MPNRILVVDDDPDVRELVRNLLDDTMFDVDEAADAEQALELLARLPDLALLMTDVRMPGLNGFELAAKAKQARPGLRILFMSGYAAEYRIDPQREDFISKPFDSRELLGCVYELMSRPTR